MSRQHLHRRTAACLTAVAALALLSGCGDDGSTGTTGDASSSRPSTGPDTALGEGRWLIALNTVGGADGETSSTTYLTLDPSTGAAQVRALPGVKAASADPASAALLVSGDRSWAIPDTGIPSKVGKSGKLTVYAVTGSSTKTLDIRALTGKPAFEAVGWAFDPTKPDTLRVVGADGTVWAVAVSGGKATQEPSLAKGPWIFTNGFNRNTGVPWVESIDSDATMPAGNGPADTSAVTRDGGTVLPSESDQLTALPPSPCRLGGGFTAADGTSWIFCAEKPSVTTYYLPKDAQDWQAYGKPSQAVAPATAGVPLVLPPASS